MASWEELPQEILELIARRLDIEEFLAFGGVCTSWRSAATNDKYNAKSKAPWIMTYVCRQIAEFSRPSTGRIYPMRVPGSDAQTLSVPGWILALRGDSDYRIFNPLSRVSIELPALEKLHHESRVSEELDRLKRPRHGPPMISMMALSSSPSLSRSYTVMISCITSPGLAFHRSGEDAWTVVSLATDLRRFTVLGLIYYDGLFVAVDAHGQILTLNERKHRMELRLVLGLSYVDGDPYLVECLGSLLVAWMIWGEGDEPVKKIRVFEVDLEKGTEEEVKSLGNASLFLNNYSWFSVEFKPKSCLPGIKPNHIYFTDYTDRKKKSYSMNDGKVETYFESCLPGIKPNRICISKYEDEKMKSYYMEDEKLKTYFDATSSHFNEAEWFQPDF
ncbi:F-box/kelch-repeat protein At1g57790-like [Syzygium oleosum]|uniref:F-box/kelch-repeat protein At1g57790-like n=1 Tax=Syzygium oleosum TaxID=219896 RepID=UPI0024B8E6A6|nr:F-box/kelch-repeat protein At1g57790-like [Syzygium oleosum]